MPLEKYEDLLDFSMKDSANHFSVRDLNTSDRKAELVAREFLAFQLEMNVIASFEELQ